MKLLIKSKDSFGESFEKTYEAKKNVTKKGIRYSYVEEGIKTDVYILDSMVKVLREGAIKSSQTLIIGEKTSFYYKTPHMVKNFDIITKKIDKTEKSLEIEYTIYEGSSEVNTIKLSIIEK